MSQTTTVVCTECKKETTVPFQPTAGRPVYCDDCFKKRRNESGPRTGGPGGRSGGGSGGPRGGGFRGRREAPRQPSFSRSDYPGHERYK